MHLALHASLNLSQHDLNSQLLKTNEFDNKESIYDYSVRKGLFTRRNMFRGESLFSPAKSRRHVAGAEAAMSAALLGPMSFLIERALVECAATGFKLLLLSRLSGL